MKKIIVTTISVLFVTALLATAWAADSKKGEASFKNPEFAGGTKGKSCWTCHENGDGLGKDLFTGTEYTIMGMEKKSLADVVNVCIERPLGGKAIDTKGEEMADVLAYMKELVEKPKKKMKKTKAIEGC